MPVLPARRVLVSTVALVLMVQPMGEAAGSGLDPSEPAEEAPATELVEERTPTSRTYANADGSYTSEVYAQPIFYRPAPDAALAPIEVGFRQPGGASAPAVSDRAPVSVTVQPPDAASGFLALDDGQHSIRFRLPAGVLPGHPGAYPAISGALASYPGFLPGIDLRVLAEAQGAKSFLVLAAPPTAPSFTFLVDSPGLTLVAEPSGSAAFRDAAGRLVARVPRPYLVDSSADPQLGSGLYSEAVQLLVGSAGGLQTLTLAIDPAYLATATYPVYLDPSTTFLTGSTDYGDAFASSKYPTTNFADYVRPDAPYYHEHWLGMDPTNSANVNEVFLRFDVSPLSEAAIDQVDFDFFPYHQYWNPPTTQDSWLSLVSGAWTESGLTWNNRPTSTDLMWGTSVEGQTAHFVSTRTSRVMLRNWVQGWVGGDPNYGIKLHENGNGGTYWKRLIGSEQGGANVPHLTVQWHRPTVSAASPLAGTWTGSRSFAWSYPGGNPEPQAAYQVEVGQRDVDLSETIASSGEVTDATARSWTLPPGAVLDDGYEYFWRVRVKDSAGWSEWTDTSFWYESAMPTQSQLSAAAMRAAELLGTAPSGVTLSWVDHDRLAVGNRAFIDTTWASATGSDVVMIDAASGETLSDAEYEELLRAELARPDREKFAPEALDALLDPAPNWYGFFLGPVDYGPALLSVQAQFPSVVWNSVEEPQTTDPAVLDAIDAAFMSASVNLTGAASAPFLAAVDAQGLQRVSMDLDPLVFVLATPAQARSLAARTDTLEVRLAGSPEEGSLQSAGDTMGFPYIHGSPRYWTGWGVKVGIVEYGRIATGTELPTSARASSWYVIQHPFTGQLLCEQGSPSDLAAEHPTRVANAAVGRGVNIGPGAAPGATFVQASAAYEPESQYADPRVLKAAECAILADKGNADLLNLSLTQNAQAKNGSAAEVFFDHITYRYRRLVVGIAGNVGKAQCLGTAKTVPSPGSAYNVLTVGGMDDKETSSWADDTLWRDPSSGALEFCYGDPTGRWKPEVVAPAIHIEAQGTLRRTEGTSLAAPLVAGTAATLIGRNRAAFRSVPEQLKAILMASTIAHPSLSRDGGKYQGLGMVSARAAGLILLGGTYGGSGTANFNGTRSGGGECYTRPAPLRVSFYATGGKTSRFVITWSSHSTSWYGSTDRLLSDIDLELWRGTSKVSTSSRAVNLQWVNWTPPASGTYTAVIRPTSWQCSNALERVGWAWTHR